MQHAKTGDHRRGVVAAARLEATAYAKASRGRGEPGLIKADGGERPFPGELTCGWAGQIDRKHRERQRGGDGKPSPSPPRAMADRSDRNNRSQQNPPENAELELVCEPAQSRDDQPLTIDRLDDAEDVKHQEGEREQREDGREQAPEAERRIEHDAEDDV